MERCRLMFSGAGGQGVITAAIILAEAAAMYENLNAVQTQTYGPEARGGSSRSEVIIADTPILFPKVIQPNVLVCLTQEAYNKFHPLIRPGGTLLSDARYVNTLKKVDAYRVELPMYKTVMEKIGNSIVFNICMLGAVIELMGHVKPESVMKVLESRMPPASLEMNRKALELGIDLASPFKR